MNHWFKHSADAHRGRSMQELMDHFGHRGPNCYWILVGLCTEKFWEDPDASRETPTFSFHRRMLIQEMRTTPLMLRKWLKVCAELRLFSYTETSFLCTTTPHESDTQCTASSQPVAYLRASSKNQIQITMPKYLEILDRDRLFTRKLRAKHASKSRDLEEEEKSPLPPASGGTEPEKKSEEPEQKSDDPEQLFIPGVVKPSEHISATLLMSILMENRNAAESQLHASIKLNRILEQLKKTVGQER